MQKEAYMMASIDFEKAQERQPNKILKEMPKHKVGDCSVEKKIQEKSSMD